MIPGFHGLDLIFIPVLFLFWIWMLVDCVLHESSEDHSKLIWLLIIIFTYIIGALIYFFARFLNRGHMSS